MIMDIVQKVLAQRMARVSSR